MVDSTNLLGCQKHLFSLDESVVYLNCAYMSPMLKAVEEIGIQAIQRKRTPSTIEPKHFFGESERVRSLFAALIGCDNPQQVAIVPAVSYGMAIAVKNLSIAPHQNVVVLDEQFPSNVYAWRRFCENGGELRTIYPPKDLAQRGKRWNQHVLDAINENTVVVALPHIHWANGTQFDLETIGKRAREVNAALIIDGTQSIGALPFDVKRIQPDAVICGGYKCMMGPYAMGAAYFGPKFNNGIPLEENWINRINSEHFSRLIQYESEYQPGAMRYDVGERSNHILLPMFRTAIEQLIAWQAQRVQAYCQALVREFATQAQQLGFWIEEETWRASNLFGVGLPPHVNIQTLNELLKANNIYVSVRGSYIRVSPNVYNTRSDMDALLNVLRQVA